MTANALVVYQSEVDTALFEADPLVLPGEILELPLLTKNSVWPVAVVIPERHENCRDRLARMARLIAARRAYGRDISSAEQV